MIITNTIAAAEVFLAISSPTTVSNIPANLESEQAVSPTQKVSTIAFNPLKESLEPIPSINDFSFDDVIRATSESEKIIGEIRQWRFLEENWDSEGAHAPSIQSIKEAVSFVRLIKDSAQMPEPMLHATGNVSLYWDEKSLYAEIEFLGDSRIAYFIKSNEDKHKGVFIFDPSEMPSIFSNIIGI